MFIQDIGIVNSVVSKEGVTVDVRDNNSGAGFGAGIGRDSENV